MKKIVHIVEAFGGGIFSLLVDLANKTSNDYEVTILYGTRIETPEDITKYFNNNVKLIQIKNFTKNVNLIKDIKSIREIKKYIKIIKPDIVHLHSSKAGVIGRIACKNTKILYSPHCFAFMQKNISKLKRFLYYWIEKIMARKRNCSIIACSKEEYKLTRNITPNVVLIENGINTEKIQKIIEPEKITPKKHTICTVGRIESQKNPEIFNEIAEKMPEYEFIWIGDGTLKNVLTASNIKITGWIPHEEVIKAINENEIFILTSKWEGLPIALLEAMYLKKICIISKEIQNTSVIKNEVNGYIAGSVNDYIEIIEKENQNIITNNAYQDIKSKYNMETYVQSYKQLIDETNIKKVVLFTEKFNDGGIEKIVVDIFSRLNRNEYEPKILAFTENCSIYNKIPKTVLIKKTPKTSLIRKLKGVIALKKYLKNNKVDIFHINIYNSIGLIYARIVYNSGVEKIIVHAHNSNIDNDMTGIKRAINYIIRKIFSKKTYTYISTSEQCSNFCYGRNIKSIIIPTQINAEEYLFNKKIRDEYRNRFGFKENDLVIGNIGRFEKQKNHKFLIKIFEKIQEKNRKSYLVLIGKGRLKKQIQKRIKKRKITNIIMLEERTDINKMLQMFDVYISTSRYEGFGLALLEAQAASLPTFCINTIPHEVQQSKYIYTISKKETPEKWAEFICQNLKSKRRRERLNSDVNKFVKKIEKFYKTIAF